jgi:hypothetical protein
MKVPGGPDGHNGTSSTEPKHLRSERTLIAAGEDLPEWLSSRLWVEVSEVLKLANTLN